LLETASCANSFVFPSGEFIWKKV